MKRKVKAKPSLGVAESVFAVYRETGDVTGFGALADWFDERGERPEFAQQLRAEMAVADRDVWFFYVHGAWSYNPATQTKEQGYLTAARQLVTAERWGVVRSCEQRIEYDHDADRHWLDGEGGPEGGDDGRSLFQYLVMSPLGPWNATTDTEADGDARWAVVGGVDLGPGIDVHSAADQPYSRVVFAELLSELMPDPADAMEVCFHRLGRKPEWQVVYSYAEASRYAMWRLHRQPQGLIGGRDIGGRFGAIRRPGDKVFAHVSYNGRVWEGCPGTFPSREIAIG